MGIKRLTSVLHYLYRSAPFWKWRLSQADCPNCGKSVFLSFAPSPFMTRCLRCRANITNLSLIPVIAKHFQNRGINCAAYELSTYGATLNYLKANFCEVVTSEYFPERELGVKHYGILNQDVQQLTFANASFDLVTSNQVFEHVPDDILGFKECWRVLKEHGVLIFSVPLYNLSETRQIAILENGNIRWLGEPEYHDSRLGGRKSAPTFWRHSVKDILARVKKAGFSHVELVNVFVTQSQVVPSIVVRAVK